MAKLNLFRFRLVFAMKVQCIMVRPVLQAFGMLKDTAHALAVKLECILTPVTLGL